MDDRREVERIGDGERLSDEIQIKLNRASPQDDSKLNRTALERRSWKLVAAASAGEPQEKGVESD
jgi:hypothetical protein